MSQRVAGAAAEPVDSEPLPEPERAVEPPKPFVIRSDTVRPQPFTLTGPSPRSRVRGMREAVRTPEVAVGAPERGAPTERSPELERPAAPERSPEPDRVAPAASAAAPERPAAPGPVVAPESPAAKPAAAPAPSAAPQRQAPQIQSPQPASVRGESFVPASYHSGTSGPAKVDQPTDQQQLLATAVFVAGSARLEPGHRYSLALRPGRLLVLGPTDVDPAAVVVDRDVAEIDVRSLDGRLILSEPNGRSGLVLAFMSVAGPSTEKLASTIAEAARAAGTT